VILKSPFGPPCNYSTIDCIIFINEVALNVSKNACGHRQQRLTTQYCKPLGNCFVIIFRTIL